MICTSLFKFAPQASITDQSYLVTNTCLRNRQLQDAVQAMLRLYEGPRYEAVTSEELAAIKSAMVSGAGGLSTHSGHWYNCENGHPVRPFPPQICCQISPSGGK